MYGQILTKLETLEKEFKEIKNLLKKRTKKQVKSSTSNKADLTLSEIAKKLRTVGKAITPKELEEEIRAVRAGEK